MQHLFGPPAFTAFQQQKIQSSTGLEGIQSAEIFFVDSSEGLPSTEGERLANLLQETPAPSQKAPNFIVVPRIGTISPWSSKATEILHACGLNTVRRVERGVAFWIEGASTEALTNLQDQVHDPMTQGVIEEIKAAQQLFQSADPKPVVR